jgi:hypothetical protein
LAHTQDAAAMVFACEGPQPGPRWQQRAENDSLFSSCFSEVVVGMQVAPDPLGPGSRVDGDGEWKPQNH